MGTLLESRMYNFMHMLFIDYYIRLFMIMIAVGQVHPLHKLRI